jgi:ComF family protein
LRAQLVKLGNLAIDLLLPQFCLGCGREGSALCSICLSHFPAISSPICRRCGLPLTRESCPNCQRREPSFDGLRSPFRFERLVREAIHLFKYQNLRCLAKPLAAELAGYLKRNPLPADLIVPVPLHRKKLRERGYNQSELVALELGRMVGLQVDCKSLERSLETKPQARLEKAAQRRRNVAGAFQCLDKTPAGRKILIIDDVATSGETIHSCALPLKQAGASSIWGLTIAREV